MGVDQADDADLEDGEISDSPNTPPAPAFVETNVATVMAPVLAHASLPAKPTVSIVARSMGRVCSY